MNMNRKMASIQIRNAMRKRFKDSGVPIEGTFELTGQCNLNCKMCYVHTHPNSYYVKGQKNGDWWIALIDQACNSGMMFALLTGGECLLHPDFERIYLHLRKKGIYTSINTNGILIDEEKIEFFKKYPPFEIQMTLYGTDDQSYEKVTGAKAFGKAHSAIQLLKDAELNLKIAVTPNTFARGETERIISYLRNQNIKYSISDAVFTSYSEQSERKLSNKSVDIDEQIRYLSVHNHYISEPIPVENLPQPGGNKKEPTYGMKCGAGRYSFFCTWDGCMQSCGSFYNERIKLKEPKEFCEVWKTLQDQSRKYLRPIECEDCPYRKACITCPTIRSGKVGNGHCDPAICDLTRRLVAAGVKKLDQPEAVDPEHGI